MYTLYILQCADNSLYTGVTSDLQSRVEHHVNGKGSKYVRSRLPFEVVYTEICDSKSAALKREIEIKKMSRKEKLLLISKNS